jgi:hypothetical protein
MRRGLMKKVDFLRKKINAEEKKLEKENLEKRQNIFKCSNGHLLKFHQSRFANIDPEDPLLCDCCRSEHQQNQRWISCNICDEDICEQCCDKLQKGSPICLECHELEFIKNRFGYYCYYCGDCS